MPRKSATKASAVQELPDRSVLKAIYDRLRPGFDEALVQMVRTVRTLLEKHGYSPTIKFRVKRFETYYEKLNLLQQGKRIGKSDVVSDILALRIVCPFLEDLEAVEQVLKEALPVEELERKGAQHSFREFGYDSVHMLVTPDPDPFSEPLPLVKKVCEVQLRTILQDAWAEVEHELIYKSDISLPNESIKRKMASLNATLTLSDLIFQEIRDYQKEIRERDRKRRSSIENISNGISIIAPGEPAAPAAEPVRLETLPLTAGRSKLEKLMLQALDAHSNNNLSHATALYTQILRLKLQNPIRSLVYNHRGMAYFAQGDYNQALRDFTRAVFFDQENYRGFTNRGLVCRVLAKYEQSVADYDRALRINPNRLEGYWGRAQSYYEMRFFTRALADCEKAISIQADFQPAEELIKRINRRIF